MRGEGRNQEERLERGKREVGEREDRGKGEVGEREREVGEREGIGWREGRDRLERG